MNRIVSIFAVTMVCCLLLLQPASANDYEYITSLLWTQPHDVTVEGDYAYCAYQSGLIILDVSDPTNPQFMSRTYCLGIGWSIDVSGDYVFLVDEWAGVQVINIADPANPFIVTRIETSDDARGIVVEDGLAYVGDQYHGDIVILDVSDPTSPQIISTSEAWGNSEALVKAGDCLYVAGAYQGMDIIDVSDPENPIHMPLADMCPTSFVAVSGNYLYVNTACGGSNDELDYRLRIYDVTDPSAPILLSVFEDFIGNVWSDMIIVDGVLYMNEYDDDHNNTLLLLDLSDPANPVRSGTLPIEFKAISFNREGNLLYSAKSGGTGGMAVIDVTDPFSPALIGDWTEAVGTFKAARRDNYLFVTDTGFGLRVVDVTNPSAPEIVANLAVEGSFTAIELTGDYAFLSMFDRGFQIINIADPQSPFLVTGLDSSVYGFDISGHFLYVTGGYDGLKIYDIGNPAKAVQIGHLTEIDYCWGVTISGDYAYLSCGSRGCSIVDVTDPTLPVLRGNIDFGYSFLKYIAASGTYIYIASRDYDLIIIDASDPDAPEYLGSYELDYSPYSVKRIDNRLYVPTYLSTLNDAALAVLDITDPASPALLAIEQTAGMCSDICVDHQHLYLICSSLQVMGFHYSAVEEPPFGPTGDVYEVQVPGLIGQTADIQFSLRHAMDLDLSIHDLTGRRQATLFDGVGAEGDHQIQWNAVDVPSGVYFVRIRTGDQIVSKQVSIIK
jgi:hypothetical protein